MVDLIKEIIELGYEVANEGVGEKVNVVNEGCEDGSNSREECDHSDLGFNDDNEVGLDSISSSDDGYESVEDELCKPNLREAKSKDEEDDPIPQKKQKRQARCKKNLMLHLNRIKQVKARCRKNLILHLEIIKQGKTRSKKKLTLVQQKEQERRLRLRKIC